MSSPVTVDRVIAFRMQAHHLSGPADGLPGAAGAIGVQDSPPGSALLALAARLPGLTPEGFAGALADRSLLSTWGVRGAPWVFPTADLDVFTTGVLPPTARGREELVIGVRPVIRRLGMSFDDVVSLVRDRLDEVLSHRRLPIGPLGTEIASRIAPDLDSARRAEWDAEGPYSPGQPAGEGVVHFALRILTLEQALCFAPRDGDTAPFVLLGDWLGPDRTPGDAPAARAELLPRFLRCYGPARPRDFASWMGVRPGDAAGWWDLLDGELTPVGPGDSIWILTEDLDRWRGAPEPSGLRLLPPHDPYLQQRDRATIAEPASHAAIWKTVGAPGAVLVDGRVRGIWRPRKQGRTLTLRVTPFTPFDDGVRGELDAAAHRMAALRGTPVVRVVTEL